MLRGTMLPGPLQFRASKGSCARRSSVQPATCTPAHCASKSHAQGRPWRQQHVAAGQDGLAGAALACSASHQLWPAPRAGPAVAAAACSGGAGWIGGGGTSMQREPSAVASSPTRRAGRGGSGM
ncbi:hypothetical protein Agub_g2359 [Astrephomene gubernaculifera]|uniref:Uncharacterized protein n=1 Tax=Astrephomene gubernaculifera TaxID=47775 RepID=A0AAD3HI19_9CHLO|nr:hypothetical protein Agub_g2359 [Astrephomene gubernaculifera]